MNEPAEDTAPASGETRRDLLQAAAELFSAKGVEKTTLREIGTRAGVSFTSINYYFRSKEALYREVLQAYGPGSNREPDAGVEELAKAALSSGSKTAAKKALQQVLGGLVQLAVAEPDPIFTGLLRHELARAEGPRDEIFEMHMEPLHDLVEALVQQARGRDLDPVDARLVAIGLLSQALYYVIAPGVALRLLRREQLGEPMAQRVARILLGPGIDAAVNGNLSEA